MRPSDFSVLKDGQVITKQNYIVQKWLRI